MRRIDALKALTGKTMVGTFSVLTDTGEAWSAAELVKIYEYLSEEIPEPKDDLCKPKAVKPEYESRLVKTAAAGSGKRGRESTIDTGKLIALAKAGWTKEKIADELKVCEATVYSHLKKAREEGRI